MTDCSSVGEALDRRIQEFGKSDRMALAAVAADMVVEGELEEEEIVTRLADFGARKPPDTLFALTVRKGVFAMNDDGEYGIPIPSMRDWLIEAYAPGQKLPAGKPRAFERGSGSGPEL